MSGQRFNPDTNPYLADLSDEIGRLTTGILGGGDGLDESLVQRIEADGELELLMAEAKLAFGPDGYWPIDRSTPIKVKAEDRFYVPDGDPTNSVVRDNLRALPSAEAITGIPQKVELAYYREEVQVAEYKLPIRTVQLCLNIGKAMVHDGQITEFDEVLFPFSERNIIVNPGSETS